MLAARNYDLTIPGNGTRQLEAVGSYVKILSATGQVRIIADTGPQLDALPGQGLRNVPFNRLQFQDLTGSGNNILVLVGSSEMVDDRITGEVTVIDSGRARSLANQAFMSAITQAGAGAVATFAQVWNSSTTKNVLVKQMTVSCNVAGPVDLYNYTATLTTLGTSPRGKKLATNSVTTQSRSQQFAGVPAAAGNVYGRYFLAANTPLQIVFSEPFVLPPSTGLGFSNPAVSVDLSMITEFTEEAV